MTFGKIFIKQFTQIKIVPFDARYDVPDGLARQTQRLSTGHPGVACGTKGLGRFRKTPASCGLARSKALKRFDPTLYTISRWGLPPRTCTSASSMPLVDVRRLSPPPLLLLLLLPRSFYLSVLPIVTRHPNKSSIYRQNFYSLDLVIKIHLRDLTLIVSSRPGYHST